MRNNKNFHAIGGRVVKWKGRVASIAPALASVSVIALMTSGAVGETFNMRITDTQIVIDDGDITVTNTGNIDVEADITAITPNRDLNVFAVDTGADYADTFTNNGVIEGYIDYSESGDDGKIVGLTIYNGLSGSLINNSEISLDLVVNDYTDPTAMGIWIDGDVSGGIMNSGTVSASILSSLSSAMAYGLFVTGAVTDSATIKNSGLIEAVAHTDYYNGSAYGIIIEGNVSGEITNMEDGVISVQASANSSAASAWGIYVGATVTDAGSITNAGLISVTAEAGGYSPAHAYGIEIVGSMGGTINNSGTITATADGLDDYATAYGIYVSGDVGLTGMIDNSGTIDVDAEGSASVYGIYVEESIAGMSGEINNSGTISATAASPDEYLNAYGISVKANEHGMSGTIDNSGSISATVIGESSGGGVYGIRVMAEDGGMSGTIVNNGTITATGTSLDSWASAYGVLVNAFYGGIAGEINNSGTVSATAISESSGAEAYGIKAYLVESGMSGNINNSGTISATANGSNTATAYGIYVRADMDGISGTITNSGTINAYAEVSAYGIYALDVAESGTVSNSGSISVHGDNDAGGVRLRDMAGKFINTGSVVATAGDGVGAAIYVHGLDGLVTLNTRGFIVGSIGLYNYTDLNVQGDVGRSVHWTVDASYLSGGSKYINNEGYRGVGVFENNTNGIIEYATFDSSGLVAVRQAGADAGFTALDPVLSQTRNAASNPAHGVEDGSAFRPFVSAASKSMTYSGGDTMLDQDVATSSISTGGTMTNDNGLLFGVVAGMVSGTATVDYIGGSSTETDQQGGFVSLSLGASSGSFDFAGAISGGRTQFDNTRYVNDNLVLGGIEAQDASFNSTVMSAGVTVSGRFNISSGMALVPNTTLRYAQHKVDGYVETGSAAAAEVGAQNFGVFEGDIGVALEKTLTNGILTGGVSLMSRRVSGDEAVQVTMIGDSEDVDATIASSTPVKLSLGYSSNFSKSGQFNLGFETLVGSDAISGGKISVQLNFSF